VPESEEDVLLAHTIAMTDPRLDSVPTLNQNFKFKKLFFKKHVKIIFDI